MIFITAGHSCSQTSTRLSRVQPLTKARIPILGYLHLPMHTQASMSSERPPEQRRAHAIVPQSDESFPRREGSIAGAGATGPSVTEAVLPAVYVVERHHVEAALAGAVRTDADGGLTLWIHPATLGIQSKCFRRMRRVSRILTLPEPDVSPSATVLGALMRKIVDYEPDLVDLIRVFVTHNGGKVHRVGEQAFAARYRGTAEATCGSRLTEVTLPNSITHIGNDAFYRCSKLTKISLPCSLTHIGDRAFRGCTGLTTVQLPNTVTHIGDFAFHDCTRLVEVTLPDSVTRIGEETFRGCTALTKIAFPNTLTYIEMFAFDGERNDGQVGGLIVTLMACA